MDLIVCGASGRQGGSVCQAALQAGLHVGALVRDASTPAAQALSAAGARVCVADFERPQSLERAFAGASAVFSVQPMLSGRAAREQAQGEAVAVAAEAAGVSHLIQASTLWSGAPTGVPHFDSKFGIEQRIHALGLPCSVLRLGGFMENLLHPQTLASLRRGRLVQPYRVDLRQPLLAAADIGAAVLWCLRRGPGEAIAVYGELLSPAEQAHLLGTLGGRDITAVKLYAWLTRLLLGRDLARMFALLNRDDHALADLPRPPLRWTSFDAWARARGLPGSPA